MELIVTSVDKAVEEVVVGERAEHSQVVVVELSALEFALVGGGVVNVAF